MRYLLLIAGDESSEADMTAQDRAEQSEAWGRYAAEFHTSGKMLGGERLRPAASATTVRKPNGRALLSDRPFVESKEQLGGFFIVEAANLDEAVEWASKMPHLARHGIVEVRPIWEMGAP